MNQIIEAGLTVNKMFVQVLPLAQPATKVVISMIHMILNKRSEELNLRFIVKVDDYEYWIFATSSVMNVLPVVIFYSWVGILIVLKMRF